MEEERKRKRRGRRQWHLKVGDFGLAVQNQGIYNPKPKTRGRVPTKRRRRGQRASLASLFVSDALRKPRHRPRRRVEGEHKAEPERGERLGTVVDSPPHLPTGDGLYDLPPNAEAPDSSRTASDGPSSNPIERVPKKGYLKSAVVGGTAPYQAPECFDGTPSEQLTAKVDGWALGCALYEAVTCTSLHLEEPYVGQLALGGEEWHLLQDEFGRPPLRGMPFAASHVRAHDLLCYPRSQQRSFTEACRACWQPPPPRSSTSPQSSVSSGRTSGFVPPSVWRSSSSVCFSRIRRTVPICERCGLAAACEVDDRLAFHRFGLGDEAGFDGQPQLPSRQQCRGGGCCRRRRRCRRRAGAAEDSAGGEPVRCVCRGELDIGGRLVRQRKRPGRSSLDR
eukprot:scaffold1140_cov251-Pinguiococcus_pyrenoidosus.AAC.5